MGCIGTWFQATSLRLLSVSVGAFAVLATVSCGKSSQSFKESQNQEVLMNSNTSVQKATGTTGGPQDSRRGVEPLSSDAGRASDQKGQLIQTEALNLLPPETSSVRFLDAFSLSKIYERVFGKGSFRTCMMVAEFCENNFFTFDESKFMGTLYFSRVDFGILNFTHRSSSSINHMQALRAGLARECEKLVKTEQQNLSTSNVSLNKLIHRKGRPEMEDLRVFARALHGISNSKIDIDDDLALPMYHQAFISNESEFGASDETLTQSYKSACVAMASDPTLVMY